VKGAVRLPLGGEGKGCETGAEVPGVEGERLICGT